MSRTIAETTPSITVTESQTGVMTLAGRRMTTTTTTIKVHSEAILEVVSNIFVVRKFRKLFTVVSSSQSPRIDDWSPWHRMRYDDEDYPITH